VIFVGRVLSFSQQKDFQKTLSSLMKEARKNQFFIENLPQKIASFGFEELEKILRVSIYDVLMKEDCQNSDYFHCGTYVSKMISDTAKNPPKSFYVIDYLSEINDVNDFFAWQQAADVCFLICSIFTGRCNHGLMSYRDYRRMGISLYSTFYSKSKRKIGYMMSDNYQTMVDITRVALKNLSI
jgi:hypothetical protein